MLALCRLILMFLILLVHHLLTTLSCTLLFLTISSQLNKLKRFFFSVRNPFTRFIWFSFKMQICHIIPATSLLIYLIVPTSLINWQMQLTELYNRFEDVLPTVKEKPNYKNLAGIKSFKSVFT